METSNTMNTETIYTLSNGVVVTAENMTAELDSFVTRGLATQDDVQAFGLFALNVFITQSAQCGALTRLYQAARKVRGLRLGDIESWIKDATCQQVQMTGDKDDKRFAKVGKGLKPLKENIGHWTDFSDHGLNEKPAFDIDALMKIINGVAAGKRGKDTEVTVDARNAAICMRKAFAAEESKAKKARSIQLAKSAAEAEGLIEPAPEVAAEPAPSVPPVESTPRVPPVTPSIDLGALAEITMDNALAA